MLLTVKERIKKLGLCEGAGAGEAISREKTPFCKFPFPWFTPTLEMSFISLLDPWGRKLNTKPSPCGPLSYGAFILWYLSSREALLLGGETERAA